MGALNRPAAGCLPVYLAAWGSWELSRYLFGTDHSQLIYSADTGLSVFDMATRSARRIAGTSRGDRPYAISADQRLFAWRSEEHTSELQSIMRLSYDVFC